MEGGKSVDNSVRRRRDRNFLAGIADRWSLREFKRGRYDG